MMKKNFLKVLAIAVCAILLVVGSIAGTMAYLTAKSNTVTNTFTVGNITITLTESEQDASNFKMVPGATILKDAAVSVDAGSESCWLFVKITEPANFSNYITYAMADGWTQLESGVYYREVADNAEVRSFDVISGRKMTVKTNVTNDMLSAIGDDYKLSITAYAVQKLGFEGTEGAPAGVAEAWDVVKNLG